ncbi:hypothetical protein [Lignipirellula cremea]|uniref:Alpha/beta hydrolase family protein n=1 Tax=Lignipirellula cremea TaxID=2528010 RepID=A0A518DL01_9BACT|nr:hypothetical protein [Lignipirellula cremea]QDU92518.1 hypothetical protein Pla8534_02660 [Lignipirellula cremea]
MKILCAIVTALLIASSASAAEREDQLLQTQITESGVDVVLFVPKESHPVRGILVHAANYEIKTNGRWPTLCRELGFAHLVTKINLQGSNRPQRLREGMLAALKQFAAEQQLPELTQVPRVGVGMSAGGMCIPMLIEEPDKLLTNAVSCSWVTDPEKIGPERAAIPELYIIGAQPDAFKMLPAIEKFYVPALQAGRPWALGLQHGCKHDWANSGTLFVPWIRAIAALRIPEGIQPGQPVPLKPVDFHSGWRGDRSTIHGQYAAIMPADDFQGDPGNAVWLPDRATACVWRAWQTKDSPVQVTIQTVDGKTKLPDFHPRKSFGVSVPQGADLMLGFKAKDGVEVSNLRFYRDDTLLGEANGAGQGLWKSPGQGAHAVWAEYESGGKTAVTNPALICVE